MSSIAEALATALEYQRSGDLYQAEQLYREIIAADPNQADAFRRLGTLCHSQGRHADAEYHLQRAVALQPDFGEAHNDLGITLAMQGRPEDAINCFRQAMRLMPQSAEAANNLGVTLAKRRRYAEAAECYRQALTCRPDAAEIHYNLGNCLREQERFAEAEGCYRQALALRPQYVEAHNNLGLALRELGSLTEATASIQESIRLRPNFPQAHLNLGLVLQDKGAFEAAVASYREALRWQPNSIEALTRLGGALRELKHYDEALPLLQQALHLDPHYEDAHNGLGMLLDDQDRCEEAEAHYREALRLRPDFAVAHNNLANTLGKLGRHAEALQHYEEALRLHEEAHHRRPAHAETESNLAGALGKLGRHEEALQHCDQALRLHEEAGGHLRREYAEAHTNRALLYLLQGNFQQGWREYEWRWQCRKGGWPPAFGKPDWDGKPLEGRTVLLQEEQGLGDTIQFIRYARLVKKRGGTVLLSCDRRLIPLFTGCAGIDQIVDKQAPAPGFDVRSLLLSLPHVLGTDLATIPGDVPYLSPDPGLVERWREQLDPIAGFRIGIAWQGNPQNPGDRLRSVPLVQFETLAQVDGVRLVSLQKVHGLDQLRGIAGRFAVTELESETGAPPGIFMDTAAIMRSLDLVITVDTAIAHLAGALAVPVWVALPFAPDWRWLLEREDSPWYPTMRLFRQKAPGDWPHVFERMASALWQLIAQTPRVLRIMLDATPAELIDKLTLLEIRCEHLAEGEDLLAARAELAALTSTRDRTLKLTAELVRWTAELKAVNQRLQQVATEMRVCEQTGDFTSRYLELARSLNPLREQRMDLMGRIDHSSTATGAR